MAGVSTDSGSSSGRKNVDQQINMIPFIDLLVSLIAFLLMTAVWVSTGAVTAKQPENAPSEATSTPPPVDQLRVEVTPRAIRVATTAADVVTIERGAGELDRLRAALRDKRRVVSNNEVWVQPESAVNFNDVARVMDAVYEAWGATPGMHPDRLPVTVRMM